jgi:hypothetical protein
MQSAFKEILLASSESGTNPTSQTGNKAGSFARHIRNHAPALKHGKINRIQSYSARQTALAQSNVCNVNFIMGYPLKPPVVNLFTGTD